MIFTYYRVTLVYVEFDVEKQNITLSLPKNILRKVKIIAINEETSVSGLLTRILEELVSKNDDYRTARQSHLSLLEMGFDLCTKGSIDWIRNDLHER